MALGLVLVVADDSSRATQNGVAHERNQEPEKQRVLESEPFTISDIFATRIKASHVTLIACGSASGAINQGDEPLGIIRRSCALAHLPVWDRLKVNIFDSVLCKAHQCDGTGDIANGAVAWQKVIKKEMKMGAIGETKGKDKFHESWLNRN